MKADKGYAGLHERGGVTSIINCYFNFLNKKICESSIFQHFVRDIFTKEMEKRL